MTTYYKVTGAAGESIHGGTGKWTPGRWRSVRGDLEPCRRGLHLVDATNLPQWVMLDAVVWEAEAGSTVIDAGDKFVTNRARITRRVGTLDRRTLVAWACDCAERVLRIFEAKHPTDDRPRKAIETTRAWLRGEASTEQVRAAAYAAYAAYVAAYAYAAAAAYAAVRHKERAWQGDRLLSYLRGEVTP